MNESFTGLQKVKAQAGYELSDIVRDIGVPPVLPQFPGIWCWVQRGAGTDMQGVVAMADDGRVLAQHCSSSEGWAKHDIGYWSNWKHEQYREHYPDGYYVWWVDDPLNSPGLDRAYQNNQALAKNADAGGEG